MLIIKSKSAYEWKTIMQAISTIVDEAVFNATSEGIMFRAMDPSHVALIDIIWSSAAFESYRCDGELIFAVRVDEFLKLLKRADKDESVEVSIKSAEREGEGENVEPSASASTLSLKFTKENSKKSRHYRLRLLEVGSSASATVTPLPKLNFTTKVTMSLNALIDTLKDIEVISDQVTIYSNGSVVQFEGKGDTGDVKVVFEQGGDEVREIIMQEGVSESRATYSIKYLLDMVNAIDDAESVAIEYSSKIPLRLEFRLPFMCKIHYYLAPRVE
jgi:proliferating cell nuclear antigen